MARIDPKQVNSRTADTSAFDQRQFTDQELTPGNYDNAVICWAIENDPSNWDPNKKGKKPKHLEWRFKFGLTLPAGPRGGVVYGSWWASISKGSPGKWRNMLVALDPSLVDPNAPPRDVSPTEYAGRMVNLRLGLWGKDNDRLGIERMDPVGGPARQAPSPQGYAPPQQGYGQTQAYAPQGQPAYAPPPPHQAPHWPPAQQPQYAPPHTSAPQPHWPPAQQPQYAPPAPQPSWAPLQQQPAQQWPQSQQQPPPPQRGRGPVQPPADSDLPF